MEFKGYIGYRYIASYISLAGYRGFLHHNVYPGHRNYTVHGHYQIIKANRVKEDSHAIGPISKMRRRYSGNLGSSYHRVYSSYDTYTGPHAMKVIMNTLAWKLHKSCLYVGHQNNSIIEAFSGNLGYSGHEDYVSHRDVTSQTGYSGL